MSWALTWRAWSAEGMWRTVPRITGAACYAGSPVGRLQHCRRGERSALTAAADGQGFTSRPPQMTQAVIGHIVTPAHRLVHGRTGWADAAAAPLWWLVGDAFGAGATAERPAGVLGAAFARMEDKKLDIQATRVLWEGQYR